MHNWVRTLASLTPRWPPRRPGDGKLLRLQDIRAMPAGRLRDAARAAMQVAYLGENRALCRILGRYKLFIDTTDTTLAPHLMFDGYWEVWLTQFLARRVKPGMTVVDVGASYGYYSVLMSDLVSATGRCVSIEPNPVICDSLEASLAVNGFAQRSSVVRCAPTESKHSEVRVFIPHRSPKNAFIMSPAESVDWSKGRAVNIPSRPLDDVCAGMARVDLVRIDANGMEPAIYDGMKRLIERSKPDIVMRFNSRRIADPAGFLAAIAVHYPDLRYLDLSGRLKPLSVTDLREKRVQDPVLFLSQAKNL